ncbi:tautomerase family protein [Exiguobacterium sp. s91]|uniref:tautomerase family protein n=1 Tax=Exiguobacterium sp. s91 TaxID=2751199 RepID=UPI001BE660F4|nr:tautomerase family protein [Exiguobacterium sp. s91]
MPLLSLNTWPVMSRDTKRQLIHQLTNTTVETLNMIPDKIQVMIHEQEPENFGKAGAMASDPTFSFDSRITNWQTRTSYATDATPVAGMAILTIDVWDTFDQKTKDAWVNKLTEVLSLFTPAPGDKILILIREMAPGNWAQNGVTGIHEDFLTKSRRVE